MSMQRILILLLMLGAAGGVLHLKSRYFVAPPAMADQAAAVAPSAAVSAFTAGGGEAVEVYGRTGCGYTRRMLADLQAASIPVRYHDIDASAERSAFHARFRDAGVMRNGSYALPVVAVAGQSLARPTSDSVIYRHQAR